MAGIEGITQVNAPTPSPSPAGISPGKETFKSADLKVSERSNEAPAKPEEAEKPRQPEKKLENVVSVSKDGDTVQVSPQGEEELKGRVTTANAALEEGKNRMPEQNFAVDDDKAAGNAAAAKEAGTANATQNAENKDKQAAEATATEKPSEAEKAAEAAKQEAITSPEEQLDKTKEAIQAAIEAMQEKPSATEKAMEQAAEEEEEKVSAADQAPQSFVGMSNQQLEQLYLKGVISRYDYEHEVEDRENRQEELTKEAGQISREMTGAEAQIREDNAALQSIETAYAENQENPRAAEERLEAMEALNTAFLQNN